MVSILRESLVRYYVPSKFSFDFVKLNVFRIHIMIAL